jgi:hypothetical protein
VAVGVLILFCAIGVSGWVGCPTNPIFPPTWITPSAQNIPHDVWQLTLQLTGGFAGIDRQLELASTGELKVTNRRRGTQVITQAGCQRAGSDRVDGRRSEIGRCGSREHLSGLRPV